MSDHNDETVLGDTQGAIGFLKTQMNGNGKVGVIGMCSGGRHTFLAACRCEGATNEAATTA